MIPVAPKYMHKHQYISTITLFVAVVGLLDASFCCFVALIERQDNDRHFVLYLVSLDCILFMNTFHRLACVLHTFCNVVCIQYDENKSMYIFLTKI